MGVMVAGCTTICPPSQCMRGNVDIFKGSLWDFGGRLSVLSRHEILAGNHVRLSGQDCERGTFSHRHAVVHDQKTAESYTPLGHVFSGQKPGQFTVSNSSLSEFGILGAPAAYTSCSRPFRPYSGVRDSHGRHPVFPDRASHITIFCVFFLPCG